MLQTEEMLLMRWKPFMAALVCSGMLAGSGLVPAPAFGSTGTPPGQQAPDFVRTEHLVRIATLDSQEVAEFIGQLPEPTRHAVSTSDAGDGQTLVYAGPFRYTIDAALAQARLARHITEPSPRVSISPQGGTIEVFDVLPTFFGFGDERSSHHSIKNLVGDAEYQRLQQFDTPSTRDQYRSELLQSRTNISDDEKLAGYIDLNLGIIALLAGNFDEAEHYLKRVALGEVESAANHRIMAMWRLGWIAHQRGDLLTAYRLHTEAQRFADDNPRTQTRAIKERAGLIMEFAKDLRHGQLAETRLFIDDHRGMIDPAMWSDAATIELMYLETWYYEGNLEKFLAEFPTFQSRIDSRAVKQLATASVFKGVAEFRLGKYTEAFDTLTSVLELELGPHDHWQAIPDLKLHALDWLVRFSERLEDSTLIDHYTMMRNSYMNGGG